MVWETPKHHTPCTRDYLHIEYAPEEQGSVSITGPTWLTEKADFLSLLFFINLYRFADTANYTALESRDPSKRSNYTGYEDEFVVSCCKINGQTNNIFLLFRLMRL